MLRIRCIFCAALMGITAACTSLMPGPIIAPLPSHFSVGPQSENLALQGRFAVNYEDVNHQAKHAYGHFSWLEAEDRVTLALNNPLGQTLAIIKVPRAFFLESPVLGAVPVTTPCSIEWSSHTTKTADSPELLMQETLGFSIPLRPLRKALLHMASSEPFHTLQEEGWIVERMVQTHFSTARCFVLEHRADPAVRVKLTVN